MVTFSTGISVNAIRNNEKTTVPYMAELGLDWQYIAVHCNLMQGRASTNSA
jgi:hypothetical protein